jgi:SAM-dependent methyltransferase
MEKMVLFRYVWERIHSAKTTANHDYFNVFLKCKSDIESLLNARGRKIPDANILVLGCGYNYPDVILGSTVAKQVIGIDVREAFWKDGFRALYHEMREAGYGRLVALARVFLDRCVYRNYFDHLRELSGVDLDQYGQDLRTYDGVHLPFGDGSFDIVCSNAVLEHVDRESFAELVREIARVTKESGISYHLWHNYYSLSGSHVGDHLAVTHPWGHLLNDPEFEAWLRFTGTYLNRMLPQEIVELLSLCFRCEALYSVDKNHNKLGLDSDFSYEGEGLLTNERERKLSQYPRELLLTKVFLFIGHKQDKSIR